MSAAGSCSRCKAPAHGGPCGAPVPLPASPVLAGAARQAAHVKAGAKLDAGTLSARTLERIQATADHVARHYRYTPAERDAWYVAHLRALTAGDTSQARAMCFELDPSVRP